MQKRISQIDAMKLICAFFVVTIHIVTDYRIQDGVMSEHVLFWRKFSEMLCAGVFYVQRLFSIFERSLYKENL